MAMGIAITVVAIVLIIAITVMVKPRAAADNLRQRKRPPSSALRDSTDVRSTSQADASATGAPQPVQGGVQADVPVDMQARIDHWRSDPAEPNESLSATRATPLRPNIQEHALPAVQSVSPDPCAPVLRERPEVREVTPRAPGGPQEESRSASGPLGVPGDALEVMRSTVDEQHQPSPGLVNNPAGELDVIGDAPQAAIAGFDTSSHMPESVEPAPQQYSEIATLLTDTTDSEPPTRVDARLVPGDYWKPSSEGWCAPGVPLRVRGRDLNDGMVYVGSWLPSVSAGSVVEPALIDPYLPSNDTSPNYTGFQVPYWPSYSGLTPSSRSAYLDWLETGRKDPGAYIGYVFLFLYGLERRILFDLDRIPESKADLPALIAELDRLLSVYVNSASFQRYASRLLEIALVRCGADIQPMHVRRCAAGSNELPLILRVVIGQLSLAGEPLPAEWALVWATSDREMPLRTPAQRCRTEFESLFVKRYTKLYDSGMAIKPCKRQVSADYKPASGSFNYSPLRISTSAPDVTSLVGPRRALSELVAECCESLEPLSRLRGKDPTGTTDVSLIAALPADLLESNAPPVFARLRGTLERELAGRECAVLPARDVFGDLLPTSDTPPSKASTVELIRIVQRAGFGVEPDVRFGGPTFVAGDLIAVFVASESDPLAPSPSYSAASLFLHLGANLAHTDGALGGAEQQRLRESVLAALQLQPAERRRLAAHLEWVAAVPPDTTRLKKRIAALDDVQRSDIGRFLVGVALADGRVEPSEVKSLLKLFRLLGLDPAGVHQAIHAAQTGVAAGDLARIAPSEPAAPNYTIPAEPASGPRTAKPRSRARALDMTAIEAKIKESAKVAAMLSEILVSADEQAAPAPQPSGESMDLAHCGLLDEKHHRLLRTLGQQQRWSRDEYERVVAEAGLLPDGALEVLNDLAFAVCDAPLLDGDDPIDLDLAVYQEVLK